MKIKLLNILLALVLILSLSLIVSPQIAYAAAAVDGVVSSGTGAANATSVTVNHTTGLGADRLTLVGVSWNCGTTDRTISSVTFTPSGGSATPITPVFTQKAGTQLRYSAIYSLPSPPSGVAGAITVTFSGTVASGIVVGVVNFSGVNQTIPLGSPNGAGSATQGTTPTVTLNGLNGDELVFDTVFQGGSGSSQTLTPSGDQTQQWNAFSSNTRAAGSTKQATSSSTTMSWTAGTASYWAIAAVPINPAPVGPTHDLTITVDPVGSGTTSPSAGTHSYPENAEVNITPTPNTGYLFDHWTGDLTGSANPGTVTMDADKNVTAHFIARDTYTLTVNTVGSGTVNQSPEPPYYVGDDKVVTLTPTPATGWSFGGWSGDLSGSANPATITMNGNKSVTATFTQDAYTLTVNTSGTGSVSKTPDQATYLYGDVVSLNAIPGSGLNFAGWSGDLRGTDNPKNITMDGNKSVTANFSVIALDGAPTSATAAPASSSISFSHTTGTGANRLMLVGVSWNCGTTDRTITSATFTPNGGSALNLSEVKTQQYYWSTNNYRYAAIYSLLNPPSEVLGTVAINFSGAVSNGIIAGAANFAGVDQTTPLGTPNGAVGTGSSAPTNSPTVTLTGLNGDELVFDTVFIGASATNHSLSADAGQTALWNVLGYTSSSTSFNALGAASTKPAGGSSVTMSWTAVNYGTTATRWAIAAVPIKPANEEEYTLTINTNGNGTVNQDPAPPYYAGDNTPVQLTAIPASGWTFSGWSGSLSGNTNPETIIMDGNKSITATFIHETYSLELNTIGNGSVVKDPLPPYYIGDDTAVQITAVPASGWTFTGWSGDLSSTDNPATITMNGNKSVTATFMQDVYSLAVEISGNGTVTKNPDPPYFIGNNTVVTLTANPDPGWSFSNWSGNISGTDNPTTITMDGNKTVTATFTQDEYYLTLNINGNGIVSMDPNQSTYHYGDVVTLTVIPDPGWSFAGWTGTDGGSSVVTMTSDKTVTGTFTQDAYTLTVNTSGNGTVTRNPDQSTYLYGDEVSLSATADNGWAFSGWNGDLSGTENPKTITMDGDKSVTANFTTGTGMLRVVTDPAVATTISLDGLARDDWGLNWVKLIPGSYALSFSDVPGMATPTEVNVSQNGGASTTQSLTTPVTIVAGQITLVTAHFVQLGNLRVTTVGVDAATIYVNGQPMDDWGMWTYLLPGEYTISFEDKEGLNTPPTLTVTVTAGQTTHVQGNYSTGQTNLVS